MLRNIVLQRPIMVGFSMPVDMTKKIFAIIGAMIAGGLGISLASLAPQAAHAGAMLN